MHLNTGPGMFIRIQVHMLGLENHLNKHLLELVRPVNLLLWDTRCLFSLCFSQLVPFPDFDKFAGFTQEENFPKFFIRMVGKQYQLGFFLINARQVKQITVLPEPHRTIGIGWHDVISV